MSSLSLPKLKTALPTGFDHRQSVVNALLDRHYRICSADGKIVPPDQLAHHCHHGPHQDTVFFRGKGNTIVALPLTSSPHDDLGKILVKKPGKKRFKPTSLSNFFC
jgi:hypothetical protein